VIDGVADMNEIGECPPSVRVFVSSTYEDLRDYRDAVLDAIHKLEGLACAMEYSSALPGTPKDECLKRVERSNVYVGVFGMRRDTEDADTGKSLTQLEYERASDLGLARLIYIIDETHPIPPKYVDTGPSADQLVEFKESLLERHLVRFFTTPDNLAAHVVLGLLPYLAIPGAERERGHCCR